jgi:hypothetical protein
MPSLGAGSDVPAQAATQATREEAPGGNSPEMMRAMQAATEALQKAAEHLERVASQLEATIERMTTLA